MRSNLSNHLKQIYDYVWVLVSQDSYLAFLSNCLSMMIFIRSKSKSSSFGDRNRRIFDLSRGLKSSWPLYDLH